MGSLLDERGRLAKQLECCSFSSVEGSSSITITAKMEVRLLLLR
jgi:hypothetical protein